MSVLFRPKPSALVHAAEAFWVPWSPVSFWKGKSVTSEVGWEYLEERRTLLFSFAPLLAVESHWKVLSLLQLVVLEFEPTEGLGPVLCDWGEKAALPRELVWINWWSSGLGELLCVGWDSIDVWNIDLHVWTLPWWQPSQKKCLYEGETLMCIKSCGCAVTLSKCLHLSVVPGSYQYFWKQFTNHTSIVIITCVLRTMS